MVAVDRTAPIIIRARVTLRIDVLALGIIVRLEVGSCCRGSRFQFQQTTKEKHFVCQDSAPASGFLIYCHVARYVRETESFGSLRTKVSLYFRIHLSLHTSPTSSGFASLSARRDRDPS